MNPTAQEKSHKAVVCMTTFNRIDCAYINQEIIKLNYSKPLPIIHTCSSGNYQKYIEDKFLACEPKSLQHGALDLLKQSLSLAMETSAPEYIVHLEGDTWIMDEQVIYDIINKMDQNNELMICASAWDEDFLAFKYLKQPSIMLRMHLIFAKMVRKMGFPYHSACRDSLATQFFVIRAVPEVTECFMTLEPIPGLDLEQALYRSFMKKFGNQNLLRLSVREPIHPFNRYVCEKLALFSQHWPARNTANDSRDPGHPRYIPATFDGKRETLLKYPLIRNGKHIQKLINSKTFEYYNIGASRI